MAFYAIEGVDGVGKSSLAATFTHTGVFTVKTPPLGFKPVLHDLQLKYPTDISLSLRYTIQGLSATGEQIREILRSDPNRTVVSDRYWMGTLVNLLAIDKVYHGDWRPHILESAFGVRNRIPKPDGYFLLRSDSDERKRRVAQREGSDRYDKDERLQGCKGLLYEEAIYAERYRGIPVHMIETTGKSIADVAVTVRGIIDNDTRMRMPAVRSLA